MKNIELNSNIVEKIKMEVPDLISEFMQSDLVKMILYGSCAKGDFKECSDVNIDFIYLLLDLSSKKAFRSVSSSDTFSSMYFIRTPLAPETVFSIIN